MLGPTLDKWNLKISGNDRLVDYFTGSLGNSKVQPEMRSTEAPYPFDAQGFKSHLPTLRPQH